MFCLLKRQLCIFCLPLYELKAIQVSVDNIVYPSIFQASLEYNFSFHHFSEAVKAHEEPFLYSKHSICKVSEKPAGGDKTGKDANK